MLPRPRQILITGANRGIGFATAAELARRGHRLILTARRPEEVAAIESRLLNAVSGVNATAHHLDLASFASIRGFAKSLLAAPSPISVILHNAGAVFPAKTRRLTEDGFEVTLAVAAVGPMLLSLALQPVLTSPSRVVGVSSALHKPGTLGDGVAFRFDDPHLNSGYTPGRAYKNAKLAQLWFLFEWERRFGSRGSHADAVSPGFIPRTAAESARGLQHFFLRFVWPMFSFSRTVTQAAQSLVRVCEEDLATSGGRYFECDNLAEPSADARSPEKAAAFWRMAEEWIAARTDNR